MVFSFQTPEPVLYDYYQRKVFTYTNEYNLIFVANTT